MSFEIAPSRAASIGPGDATGLLHSLKEVHDQRIGADLGGIPCARFDFHQSFLLRGLGIAGPRRRVFRFLGRPV